MSIHPDGSEEPYARKRPRTIATLRVFDRLLLQPGERVRSELFALNAPDLRARIEMVVVPVGRDSMVSTRVDARGVENNFVPFAETSSHPPGCSIFRIPPLDGRVLRVVVEANVSAAVLVHSLCIRLVDVA